jgi:ankyrin repeat protein
MFTFVQYRRLPSLLQDDTAFISAAKRGHGNIVELLLARGGIGINAQNKVHTNLLYCV